jgi:hypothetical protein
VFMMFHDREDGHDNDHITMLDNAWQHVYHAHCERSHHDARIGKQSSTTRVSIYTVHDVMERHTSVDTNHVIVTYG